MTASLPNQESVPSLSSFQADDVADYCLRAVGPTQVSLIGSGLVQLVAPLRAAGCNVVSHQDSIPVDVPAACTIIAWVDSDEQRRQLFALNARALILVTAAMPAEEAAHLRDQAHAMGWQQHPARFVLSSSPDEVQVHPMVRLGVSVCVPDGELLASYHGLAAALVRPGDAVVATDAADHGLWRILMQQTRCRSLLVIADAPAPASIESGVTWEDVSTWQPAAHSVDVVVSVVPNGDADWKRRLIDAHAALARGGRFVVAFSPTRGIHVDERAVLAILESLELPIDRAWRQDLSRAAGADQFIEIARGRGGALDVDSEPGDPAGALVVMAVKTAGQGIPRKPGLEAPNIIAFQRDYLDASVVRLIVAMGLRLESAPLRRQLAQQLMLTAPPESADYGAALCVLLYDPVVLEGEGRDALLDAARRYVQLTPGNPTVLRWQVSVTYAAAALCHAAGDLERAGDLYAEVLAFDVLAFSPLLGTKTTAAAVRLGWIQFGRGNVAAARQAWSKGLSEAKRLASQAEWTEVVGNVDSPETFGMPEFAAVMDEAGRLASALRVTAEEPLRPGLAWQWANQSLHQLLAKAYAEKQRRQLWQEHLQEAKDWLDGQYHQLNAELQRRDASLQLLQSDNASLTANNAGAVAAFRLSHLSAEAEKADLLHRLEQAKAQFDRVSRQHAELLQAARELSAATGGILSRVPQARLPAESIAAEMSRLATALDKLPWKTVIRSALRMLSAGLGRK